MCDKLVTKINALDTSRVVLKSQHSTDKSSLEKKIDDANKKIFDINGVIKNRL